MRLVTRSLTRIAALSAACFLTLAPGPLAAQSTVGATYQLPDPAIVDVVDVLPTPTVSLGPDSEWITGQLINVDGGHSLRRGPNFRPFIEPALGKDVIEGGRT